MACWIVYRLSLDEGGPDEAQDRLALLAGAARLADHRSEGSEGSEQVLSRRSVLLPLVATAFEAVIATLLLKTARG